MKNLNNVDNKKYHINTKKIANKFIVYFCLFIVVYLLSYLAPNQLVSIALMISTFLGMSGACLFEITKEIKTAQKEFEKQQENDLDIKEDGISKDEVLTSLKTLNKDDLTTSEKIQNLKEFKEQLIYKDEKQQSKQLTKKRTDK